MRKEENLNASECRSDGCGCRMNVGFRGPVLEEEERKPIADAGTLYEIKESGGLWLYNVYRGNGKNWRRS